MTTFSCHRAPEGKTLKVAAAASTKYMLDSLMYLFEESTGVVCQSSYASSGLLASQILEGAPYDIFISADEQYSHTLAQQDIGHPPVPFGGGQLVFWTMQNYKTEKLKNILDSCRRIALPNPRVAPFGRAARQYLEGTNQYDRLESKLIFGESVGQTSHFITSGAVDGGFTARSITTSSQWKDKGSVYPIYEGEYSPLHITSTVLSQEEKAVRFQAFLQSKTARQILEHYGYATLASTD